VLRLGRLAEWRRETAMFARFAVGLRGFLRETVDEEEVRRELEQALASRGEALISLLRRAVYDRPGSPYLALLRHAGLELGDVERLVADAGVEAALARLYDEGVHVTVDEAKGHRPIERAGLTLDVTPSDFDNPLLVQHFESRSGGSGGRARPITGSLDLLSDWARASKPFYATVGGDDDALVFWYPPPPGTGLQAALISAKLGLSVTRWFTPSKLDGRGRLLTRTAWLASRLWGHPFPWPEYVAPADALMIAHWIAESRDGHGVTLGCTPSSAVRICSAALAAGLDISGTRFTLGSEPYTEAKAEIVESAGCRGLSPYGMTELGWIGMPCGSPVARDDVHVMLDKVALLERPRLVAGAELNVLFFTSLQPTTPKIALNLESGDYAAVERRDCGCWLSSVGLDLHLHTIRSHEKLTSEGVTFFGEELVRVIERLLPERFGGGPTDYQLVEEEREGTTKLTLLVSPRLGDVADEDVAATVLDALGRNGYGQAQMAELLRGAQTLEVRRAEPHVTAANKVLPLHVLRSGRA
jgi:hypothetical protein